MGTWRKRLGRRAGSVIFLTVAVGFLHGCRQDDEISELIENSPFKTAALEIPSEILVVACQYCPLEMPGHVDITLWPFWKQYSALASPGSGHSPDSADGFPIQQLRLWQANGFLIAVAPMSSWPDFRQMVIQSGGKALPQSSALIRRPVDTARFAAYWLDKEQSVFISKGPGAGRALSLPVGDCALAVNCIPGLGGRRPEEFYLKIVPEVYSALEDQRINQTGPEDYFRVKENPKVTFDPLNLGGTIRSGEYIVIIRAPGTTATGTLGSLFFSRNTEGQNRQMIVVIAPGMQTGKKNKI